MRVLKSASVLAFATWLFFGLCLTGFGLSNVATAQSSKPKPRPNSAPAHSATAAPAGNNALLYAGAALLLVLGGAALALRGKKSESPAVAAPKQSPVWPQLCDGAGIGYAETDAQGHIVRHNTAFSKLTGQKELRGVALERFSVPENAIALREQFEALRGGTQTQFQVEHDFYRADGNPFQGRLTVQKGVPGAFAAALLEDVTARHSAEINLQAARGAIHDLSTVVAGETTDLNEKIRALLAMGCGRFGLETGLLSELVVTSEPVEGALPRSVRAEVMQAVSPDERIRRGRSYDVDVATGVATGAPQGLALLTRLALSGDTRPHQATNDRGTILGVIVTIGGQIYGLLNFSSFTPRPSRYESSDLELLQLMAQWIGGEIERAETRAALDARQQELETKQMELLAANAQLEALATTDGLTGVKNRRSFDQRLEEEFLRARRYGLSLSVLLLDVDKFKNYNDSFGHPAGDEVLKRVARVLQDGVRATDFVARYGGEEFVLILPNTEAPGAMILADRLRQRIEEQPWTHKQVTASFGVSTFRAEMKSRAEITAAADAALYHSKEQGRNRVTHVQELTTPAAPANS